MDNLAHHMRHSIINVPSGNPSSQKQKDHFPKQPLVMYIKDLHHHMCTAIILDSNIFPTISFRLGLCLAPMVPMDLVYGHLAYSVDPAHHLVPSRPGLPKAKELLLLS